MAKKPKPKPKSATKKPAKPRKGESQIRSAIQSRSLRKLFLELYRKIGKASVVLRHMGLSRCWLDKWRNKSPEFLAAIAAAHEDFIDGIEEEARRRAVDGVVKDVYHHGRVVGKEKVYSDRLLAMMLRAHRPDVYRDNSRVEHAGEVASKVTIDYSRRLPNPDEARERVLAAAALLQPSISPAATNGNGHAGANGNGNGHHKNGNGHSNGHH